MLIWIFQTGEPLHCDEGNQRPMRAMNLANKLSNRGHHVVIWSSAFYHQKKIHRCKNFSSIIVSEFISINLIPSFGYLKNIGFSRLFDHAQLAFNLHKVLKSFSGQLPDVAFIGFPPIEASYVLSKWLRKKSIPSILDIKDQWPEIFIEKFPNFLKPLARFIFFPYFVLSKSTFKNSTVICSMSNSFIKWALLFSGRDKKLNDMVVPLSAPKVNLCDTDLSMAKQWWIERGLDDSIKNRLSFVGSISPAFDFTPIRDLAKRLYDEKIQCQIVICGHGSELNTVTEMMFGLPNVLLVGWIDQPKINVLYTQTMAVLAPYVKIDNFNDNVPNKVIDCFSFSLPLITSLGGEVRSLIDKYDVGATYTNADQLYIIVKQLIFDSEHREIQSKNAYYLYKSQFDFDIVYDNLIDSIEQISCDVGR